MKPLPSTPSSFRLKLLLPISRLTSTNAWPPSHPNNPVGHLKQLWSFQTLLCHPSESWDLQSTKVLFEYGRSQLSLGWQWENVCHSRLDLESNQLWFLLASTVLTSKTYPLHYLNVISSLSTLLLVAKVIQKPPAKRYALTIGCNNRACLQNSSY